MSRPPDACRIAVIPGDGIGPEVTDVALPVLEAAMRVEGGSIEFEHLPWGADHHRRTGRAAPDDAAATLRPFDAVLFGAVGDPTITDHELVWGLILRLRQELDLSLNLRPIVAFPGIPSVVRGSKGTDVLFVRENTEGEYTGIGGRTHAGTPRESAVEVAVHSRAAIEPLARSAFERARPRRRKVTLVSKSNAQRFGYSLWEEVFADVARSFPDVENEVILVDAMAAELVQRPSRFDVVLTSNLFGDILSDLGSVLAGGLGMAPSGNLSYDPRTPGIFEPVHGSAPDIAGRGIANPLATVLSGALLLEHLGHRDAAAAVRAAVGKVVASPGTRTPDLGGSSTTRQVGDELLDAMAHPPGADATSTRT